MDLEGGQLGLGLGLLHLRQDILADGRRAEAVAVQVQHPQGFGRHVGALQRPAQKGQGDAPEGAKAQEGFQGLCIHS